MSLSPRRPMLPRPLLDMAQDGDRLCPRSRIHHAHSLAPARVDLADLRLGRNFLERWPIRDIHPENDWRRAHYVSNAPATFVLRDVMVHSAAGLLRIGDEIVAETITFSDPAAHGYAPHPDGLVLQPGRVTALSGTHVSTLTGLGHNYYHAIVDGVAKLGMVPHALLAAAQGVLCTTGAAASFALDHGWHAIPERRVVATTEAFHVETLILPLSLHHDGAFHPCLRAVFDRISAAIPDDDPSLPRRFYVDRRGAPARRLLNETEVIDGLRPMGFVPIRPETLSLAQQLRLFRNAEAIVAPHGAALTNLGWCRPGCRVLELQMDAYAHWFFRNLAGLCRLDYDCIFGRAIDPWPADPGRTQGLRWMISAAHVVAGAGFLLGHDDRRVVV